MMNETLKEAIHSFIRLYVRLFKIPQQHIFKFQKKQHDNYVATTLFVFAQA